MYGNFCNAVTHTCRLRGSLLEGIKCTVWYIFADLNLVSLCPPEQQSVTGANTAGGRAAAKSCDSNSATIRTWAMTAHEPPALLASALASDHPTLGQQTLTNNRSCKALKAHRQTAWKLGKQTAQLHSSAARDTGGTLTGN